MYICNRVHNQQPVDIWRQSCTIPLPKKGGLCLAINYRGISLTPSAAKIYNNLLLHRIRPVLENILRDNQNGFREKRSTTAQIFTLRRIIEGVKQKQLLAVIIFADFSKALDSIDPSKMEQILKAYGIPNEIIKAIMIMYKNTQAFVRSPDGDTEFFNIIARLLQGDTLAPYLFIIVLDYVLRNLDQNKTLGFTLRKQLSRRYPAEMLTDADFDNVLVILSDKIRNAEKLLKILETAVASVGLYMNTTKTKLIAVNTEGIITAQNGCDLKQVKDFNYLDSKVISLENDIQMRIGSAWSTLNKLTPIWRSNLDVSIKREFFKTTVESVLTYSLQAWTLTRSLESKLNGAYTRILRAALNVHWSQRVTNKKLYNDLPKITETIRYCRLKFS